MQVLTGMYGMNFVAGNGLPAGQPELHSLSGLMGGYGSWFFFFVLPSVVSILVCCCLYVARYGFDLED